MIEVEFRAPEEVASVDLRLVPGSAPSNWSAPIRVYANVDGEWQTVYWGRFSEPGLLIRTVPIRTARVRVEISHPRRKEVELGMLRFYGPVKK
jgi:hypothetical protein